MFARLHWVLLVGILSGAFAVGAPLEVLADDGVAAAVEQLLNATWDDRPSPSSRLELDRIYDEHAALPDGRVEYAYALSLAKQYRFADALKAAEQALAARPKDLDASRLKIWLEVTTKSYASALSELDRVRDHIPPDAPADPAAAEQAAQYVRFLGRMIGFLQGPVGDSVSEVQLQKVSNAYTQGLPQVYLLQFEIGRQQILDEYTKYLDEIEKVERANRTEQKEQKAEELAALDKERERRDERLEQLSDQTTKLRDELKSELTDIANKDAPLRQQLARLEAQGLAIRRELAFLSNAINRLEAQLEETEDPFLRDRLQRELSRLSFLGRRYSDDLNLLEREAFRLGGERARLAMRQQQATSQVGGQLNQAAEEKEDLAKKDKKLAIQEKRIIRSRVGTSRQARALATRAETLSTYDPFPLEEKRRQLLESVR